MLNTKLTELLVTLLVIAGNIAAAIEGSLSWKYAALAAAISSGLYSLSRGLAKFGNVTSGTPGVIVPQPVQNVPTVTTTTPPAG